MAKMITVATRLPENLVERLPEAGIKGRRAEWLRDAIEDKLKKENPDDSLLCTRTESEPKAT